MGARGRRSADDLAMSAFVRTMNPDKPVLIDLDDFNRQHGGAYKAMRMLRQAERRGEAFQDRDQRWFWSR